MTCANASLNDLTWKVGNVTGPIAKAGSESVHGRVINLHTTQHHFHGHIAARLEPARQGRIFLTVLVDERRMHCEWLS
jgi:hypothetical protein